MDESMKRGQEAQAQAVQQVRAEVEKLGRQQEEMRTEISRWAKEIAALQRAKRSLGTSTSGH